MTEYIDREAAKAAIFKKPSFFGSEGSWCHSEDIGKALEDVPAADVVPAATYKQAIWERDTALGQLKEIDKGLGEKMDDVVPVVRCKDCERSYIAENRVPEERTRACWLHGISVADDFFCGDGLNFEDEA